MTQDRQHETLVAERAALWCSQLADADVRMRREFVQWLKQSPLHVREMLCASALDLELGRFDPERRYNVEAMFARGTNNVTPLLGEKQNEMNAAPHETGSGGAQRTGDDASVVEAKTETKPRAWKPSSWLIGIAAAASILMLALSWPGIISGVGLDEQQYLTQIGEQRTIPLADGSVIHLNTQSSVRVAFSEDARDVYLEEGQAAFDVAHDAARPFRVHVRNTVVQAIGTQFDVNAQTEHVDVAVIEGRVRVSVEKTKGATTELAAGKALSVGTNGRVSAPADVKVSDVTAWRTRRLVFRNHTLAQMAAEFNRYNKAPKIRVEGPLLQAKRFSGTFDANDPESFLAYLAIDNRLAFDRSAEQVTVRFRSSYATAPAQPSRIQSDAKADVKMDSPSATRN